MGRVARLIQSTFEQTRCGTVFDAATPIYRAIWRAEGATRRSSPGSRIRVAQLLPVHRLRARTQLASTGVAAEGIVGTVLTSIACLSVKVRGAAIAQPTTKTMPIIAPAK